MNEMRLRYPDLLKPNDVIGVIAPSEPITSTRMEGIEQATNLIKKMGLQVELSRNFKACEYYMAGSIEERAVDINEFIKRPDIKAIWTGWGGKSSNQLLDFIDWDMLRRHPKILVGFSDTTNIINAAFAKCNLVAFHGPHVFGKLNKLSRVGFRNIEEVFLKGNIRFNIDNLPYTILKSGVARGHLVGGNLKSFILANLHTKYEPSLDGAILFWETGSGTPQEIDQFLTYLNVSGTLGRINGMLIGDLNNCKDKRDWGERGLNDVILGCCNGFDFPIIRIDAFGHGNYYNTILPIGITASVNTNISSVISFESSLI